MAQVTYHDYGDGQVFPVVEVDGRELVYTGDHSQEAVDEFVEKSRVELWCEEVSESAAKAIVGADWEDIQSWLWDLLSQIGDEYGIMAPMLLPEQAVVMVTATLAKNWPLMAFLDAQRMERDIWEGLHPGESKSFGALNEGPSGHAARNLRSMLESLTEDTTQD